MGHSDDEDDFLSADEGDEGLQLARPGAGPALARVSASSHKEQEQELSSTLAQRRAKPQVSSNRESEEEPQPAGLILSSSPRKDARSNTRGSPHGGLPEESGASSKPANLTANSDSSTDADEDAIAERIRERNLQIARKFSAEIAKTVKASAPIPMISTGKSHRLEVESAGAPGCSDPESPGYLPPAPPPTPALSSSLNTSEAQPSLVQETGGGGGTRYGWRIPATPAATGGNPEPKLAQAPQSTKSDAQPAARLALDRLSERLSQTDNSKSLFERVTEDIRKVSLGRNSSAADSTETPDSAIPIISDLGNALGSLGWNSASNFFSSATQLTSRVGSSVLDSVANVTQQATRPAKEQNKSE